MHQRGSSRPNQQHIAKYRRMEQVNVTPANDDRASAFDEPSDAAQASTRSAPRSPLLDQATKTVKTRNWSVRSGDSFTDDLAAIEAAFADSEWLASGGDQSDKHPRKIESQRLGGFPTSLPSLVSSPIASDTCQLSSASSVSPARGRLRIFVDGIGREDDDADGGESMAASVYDNYTHHSQNLDSAGDTRRSALSKLDLAAQNPKSDSHSHHTVTFMDPVTSSPDSLTVPQAGYRRKTGSIGSTPGLAPDGQPYNLNGGRTSLRGRSRSPTPRLSLNDGQGGGGSGGGGGGQPDGNGVTTPEEAEKKESKGHSGPSSRRTVLIIAGLFVVGLILILSGIIVLTVEHHTAFRVAGCSFLGLGITFFIICLILQRKNVKKLVNQLENDLYFLNVTDNKIWNMIFHFDEQLHWS